MAANRVLYDYSPLYSKLTQGSIINGCVAEAFPNQEVFGVIVTPRCDLSHEGKVLTVHYVPLVPFELWFDKIAKPIIKEQWKKELANKLDSKFKNAKVGVDVMEANFAYEDLCKIVEQKVIKQRDKIEIKEMLDAFLTKVIWHLTIIYWMKNQIGVGIRCLISFLVCRIILYIPII